MFAGWRRDFKQVWSKFILSLIGYKMNVAQMKRKKELVSSSEMHGDRSIIKH